MRQVVERDVGWAALTAFVAVLVAAIYDRWTWSRRPPPAPGAAKLALNAGVVALNGGTVTVIGSAAGTHGGQ